MLTIGIEVILAVVPRQLRGEGCKEIVDGPGDDHVVVETDEAGGHEIGETQPFEQRRQIGVNRDGTQGGILGEDSHGGHNDIGSVRNQNGPKSR